MMVVNESILNKPIDNSLAVAEEADTSARQEPEQKPLENVAATERVALSINGFSVELTSIYNTSIELSNHAFSLFLTYQDEINKSRKNPTGVT